MIYYSDIVTAEGINPDFVFVVNDKKLIGKVFALSINGVVISNNFVLQQKNIISNLDCCNQLLNKYNVKLSNADNIIEFVFFVQVLKPQDKYIICDIDFTISATTLIEYLSNNILKMKSINNSSRILNELAKEYKIIYLTGRHHSYTRMTRIWLEKNDFPQGAILARKNETSFELKQYKSKTLENIVNISKKGIGIGDQRSDIKAYKEQNIIPVMIKHPLFFFQKYGHYKEKKNYYEVDSWIGISKLFHEKLRNIF